MSAEEKLIKPIKVCFVSLNAYHLFNPETKSVFGGAEVQLYYLGVEMARDPRFSVSFITGDHGQQNVECREGVTLYKYISTKKNIKFVTFLLWHFNPWLMFRRVNADVYVQRASSQMTGEIALFCRLMGKKFIYMVAHDNDVITDKRPAWMPKGVYGQLTWKSFQFGLRWAHAVIVQHEGQRRYLERNYGKEGYMRHSAHRIPDESALQKKTFILWVARCEDWKQPEVFIELSRSFPCERFCMVCPTSHDLAYFNLIKKAAWAVANMTFIDFVPFSEVDDYFMKAKIFVNTSKAEGFPNTFIQAAKCKTPILSLSVSPDNMLEKYDIGVCANGDRQKLTMQLNALLTDGQKWKTMSDNAYSFAKNRHDIKKIVENDKRVFLHLMNREDAPKV